MLDQEEEASSDWLLPEALARRMEVRPAHTDAEHHFAETLLRRGEALWAILQAGAMVHLNGPAWQPGPAGRG
eukprot:8420310-Prorocentrum_lima.AAC.1